MVSGTQCAVRGSGASRIAPTLFFGLLFSRWLFFSWRDWLAGNRRLHCPLLARGPMRGVRQMERLRRGDLDHLVGLGTSNHSEKISMGLSFSFCFKKNVKACFSPPKDVESSSSHSIAELGGNTT